MSSPGTAPYRRLAEREFLCGDYSIADVATWPWVRLHAWSGIEVDDLPHLRRWIEAVAARPAVQRGVAVPGNIPPDAPRPWLEAFRAAQP